DRNLREVQRTIAQLDKRANKEDRAEAIKDQKQTFADSIEKIKDDPNATHAERIARFGKLGGLDSVAPGGAEDEAIKVRTQSNKEALVTQEQARQINALIAHEQKAADEDHRKSQAEDLRIETQKQDL
ncbi:unnamed protein product, partial [Phaeothamnion confervicola]